ncbi:MAG: hypothetical protein H0A76_12760 [Candidatus Thiodubiliella endoseptemdiera]|uniref:Uncharacterized protein n=1 Tax=Candidatus Thiodubiliella endoseptemdiera TaxID=2738886 RepID=A0A853F6G0_9GAMM|nr:hypothetical protein [Candidatus Thiodubiliella endoseptemdiera]
MKPNYAFPGAMSESHQNKVSDVSVADIGIVSPDGRDGMIQHAQQFSDAHIPFIFAQVRNADVLRRGVITLY